MIAVNRCFERAPWADLIYACDRHFWDEFGSRVCTTCTGELWTINEGSAKTWGLNYIASEPGGGVSGSGTIIRQGGNSGFQAVSLALLFGVSRITLLGFDMQFTRGRKHWHADHAKNNPTQRALLNWQKNFGELAAATSTKIENASRETALRCFPRKSLDACLSGA